MTPAPSTRRRFLGGTSAALAAAIAGVHLVRRAGGRVTDLHDERWQHDSVGLVASNGEPAVHDALLAAVADWA